MSMNNKQPFCSSRCFVIEAVQMSVLSTSQVERKTTSYQNSRLDLKQPTFGGTIHTMSINERYFLPNPRFSFFCKTD